MNTCTLPHYGWHRDIDGHHCIDDKESPCNTPLNQHGLCPLHDGPLCSVCGLTLADAGDRRYGAHKGCQEPVRAPEQPPMSDEDANAMLWSMEWEYMRYGGRQGWARDQFGMSDRGKTQEELRRERRR